MALDALTPWRLLAVLALVLLNGFFVASEFAIVKVRRTQLAARLEKGDPRARLATHVVEHLDAYLSATQLGITLASLGLGWIGEPFVASLIEEPLHALGVGSQAVVETVGFAIAFGIITFLHIVVGELAPKSLAIQRAEGVALWTARPLRLFYLVFRPFIFVLNGMANLLLRGIGIRPASESELVQSEEELRMLLAEAGEKRALKRERAELALRAFRLGDLAARQVMTPRTRVIHLDLQRSFEENLVRAKESGYSRFPVADGSIDRVLGMVHYRDLHDLAESGRPQRDLRAILRPVRHVPETAPVEDVLRDLLRRGLHMAVVLDEHGSTEGILTLEDIFEELFGEIRDEFDTAEGEGPLRMVADGHYVMDGGTPVHQARAVLEDLPEPDAEVDTMGGYVVARLGRLPAKGERVRLGGYEVVVREVDRRRVQTLEVWRRERRKED